MYRLFLCVYNIILYIELRKLKNNHMINKRFTITKAELNSGNVIIISDIKIEINEPDARGTPRYRYMYPTNFQIINDTKGLVEVNFFNSGKDYNQYTLNPDMHAFIRVPNSFVLQDEFGIEKFEIFIVKGSIECDSDLVVELLNYKL